MTGVLDRQEVISVLDLHLVGQHRLPDWDSYRERIADALMALVAVPVSVQVRCTTDGGQGLGTCSTQPGAQSLRDALISHWDETCNGVDWLAGTPEEYASEAIRFLAAHPAEPAPGGYDWGPDWDQEKYEAAVAKGMPRLPGDRVEPATVVTDEAVEAELLAAIRPPLSNQGDDPWRKDIVHELAPAVRRMLLGPRPLLDRVAVGRALGLLIAGFDANDDTSLEWTHCAGCPREPGPCACSGDAMARRELVDAVMHLARPMPAREQIEQRVRRVVIDGGAHITHAQEAASEIGAAIEALLNGAES